MDGLTFEDYQLLVSNKLCVNNNIISMHASRTEMYPKPLSSGHAASPIREVLITNGDKRYQDHVDSIVKVIVIPITMLV